MSQAMPNSLLIACKGRRGKMDVGIFIAAWVAAFSLGYMLGRWGGYKDAQPKRDKRGRFIKD